MENKLEENIDLLCEVNELIEMMKDEVEAGGDNDRNSNE